MKKILLFVTICFAHTQHIQSVENSKKARTHRPFVYLNRDQKIAIVMKQLKAAFESYAKNHNLNVQEK